MTPPITAMMIIAHPRLNRYGAGVPLAALASNVRHGPLAAPPMRQMTQLLAAYLMPGCFHRNVRWEPRVIGVMAMIVMLIVLIPLAILFAWAVAHDLAHDPTPRT
jgi:hypothetical protein